MNQNQVPYIRKLIRIGKELKRDHPEIRDLRLEKERTYKEIEKYLVEEKGVEPMKDLWRSAGFALTGHPGGLGVAPFEGLIPDRETRERISLLTKLKGEVSQRGVESKGYHLWKKAEEKLLLQLTKDPRYWHSSGKAINWKRVEEKMIRHFPERDIHAYQVKLYKLKEAKREMGTEGI